MSGAGETVAGDEPATTHRALLELCGKTYGELGLAIAFTAGNRGDAGKRAHGWKATQPLRSAEHGRAFMGTAIGRNPIVVLGASNLIGIDVDGSAGRDLISKLGITLPPTVTVKTASGGHGWFRPPISCPDDVVKIQFAETVTVNGDGYLVCPPGRHPSGATYSFVSGREPWTVPIAEIPLPTVTRIIRAWRRDDGDLREGLATEPDFKVPEGTRREFIFRLASMIRRWTASEELIVTMCAAWNDAMCDPPLSREQVRGQVEGAMKMSGGQEFEVVRLHELVEKVTGR